jgi:SNF2 family DNA or RNA helicase
MLRRRKTDVIDGKPLLELPGRHVSIVPCEFDEDERQFYSALENKIDEAMQKYVQNNEVMRNYTNVMVLLLRLRQGTPTMKSTSPLHTDNRSSLQSPFTRHEGLQH